MKRSVKASTSHRSILIFGGAGFIGCNWAEHCLSDSENHVHIFDNLSRSGVHANLEWLRRVGSASRLQVTIGDIRDQRLVEAAVREAGEIYHFAAQTAVTNSLADPRHDFEVNVLGTFNILEAARKSGHRPFLLFTSTNKVYGAMSQRATAGMTSLRYLSGSGAGVNESQPLDFHSPYGCSKGAADQYVRDYARIYSIPAVVFRMSCIAGPRQFGTEDQGWISHFVLSAVSGLPLTIYGDGRQVRDVLHVADVVRAFQAARASLPATEGEIYNVGGGPTNSVSVLELLEKVERLTGRAIEHSFGRRRGGDQSVYITDHSKLTRATGWRPRLTVGDCISDVYRWWLENQASARPVSAPVQILSPVPQVA